MKDGGACQSYEADVVAVDHGEPCLFAAKPIGERHTNGTLEALWLLAKDHCASSHFPTKLCAIYSFTKCFNRWEQHGQATGLSKGSTEANHPSV